MKKMPLRLTITILAVLVLTASTALTAQAAIVVDPPDFLEIISDPTALEPFMQFSIGGENSDTVSIIVFMTVLMLLPSIIMMMTSFVRIIVVFSLLRNAIGIQQTPPNQVLVGLALMLTLFIMNPVISEINETAYQPFSQGEIGSTEFLMRASRPLHTFMLGQITEPSSIHTFYDIANRPVPLDSADYAMDILIPAFVLSELKWAFTIGFLLFIPFLIIDMVVASALMSMGMMMLPPVTISMPFKLMLFVLVDGWGLLIRSLVTTFFR
jgi:flagellar biosynthetic protein FliP